MPPLIVFEDATFADLLPLTYWRSVFELRAGRKTLLDRIAFRLNTPVSGVWVRDWLAPVAGERCRLPVNRPVETGSVLVNGLWLVDRALSFHAPPFVGVSDSGRIVYVACDDALARRVSPRVLLDAGASAGLARSFPSGPVEADLIRYPWDIVRRNADLLHSDWAGRDDAALIGTVHPTAVIEDRRHVHIGDKAVVEPLAVLDATRGPIFIADNALIESHATVRGPAYVGVGAAVRCGAVIREGTSVGPVCKVGGEIDAAIFSGFSNKQHDGFLGHSYVANWVNIGASTSNSDLKNTYGTVRALVNGKELDTGSMFYGAAIGDHAKLAINQSIPAGASIGFAANVACGGLVPKFVPSLAWLTDAGLQTADVSRVLATAAKVMARRHVELTAAERALFEHIASTAPLHERRE